MRGVVTQDGAPRECSYSISPSNSSFPAAGGSRVVTVKTRSGCAWTALSLASWITITSPDAGTGPGTVTVSVAPNTSGVIRKGTLTIAGKTFTVKQSR